MMEMLLTNPGQIISVEQFMERIWGYDSDAELNVVWVYISCLRKKLTSLHSLVKIKSSRGAELFGFHRLNAYSQQTRLMNGHMEHIFSHTLTQKHGFSNSQQK